MGWLFQAKSRLFGGSFAVDPPMIFRLPKVDGNLPPFCLLLPAFPLISPWSPTRLEGMETFTKAAMIFCRTRLRPALRGWKHARLVLPTQAVGGSPTRLEGMETATSRNPSSAMRPSPTSLEGMETVSIVPYRPRPDESPTRLEGMETNTEVM